MVDANIVVVDFSLLSEWGLFILAVDLTTESEFGRPGGMGIFLRSFEHCVYSRDEWSHSWVVELLKLCLWFKYTLSWCWSNEKGFFVASVFTATTYSPSFPYETSSSTPPSSWSFTLMLRMPTITPALLRTPNPILFPTTAAAVLVWDCRCERDASVRGTFNCKVGSWTKLFTQVAWTGPEDATLRVAWWNNPNYRGRGRCPCFRRLQRLCPTTRSRLCRSGSCTDTFPHQFDTVVILLHLSFFRCCQRYLMRLLLLFCRIRT